MSGTDLSIGVCSWSIDRDDCLHSIQIAANELKVKVLQIGLFSQTTIESTDADAVKQALESVDMHVPSVFIGFEGEDYSSIKRINETGGFTPDGLYKTRLERIRKVAEWTNAISAKSISIHIGTIPVEHASPVFEKLVARCHEVVDLLANHHLRLLLETGREPIDTLIRFIEAVGRPDVGINFDPANLVIYGTDDPVSAIKKMANRIEIVHLKDAHLSLQTGVEYGQAASLGSGDVQIPRIISKLRAKGYTGPLLIENNMQEGGIDSIRNAINYVRSMLDV